MRKPYLLLLLSFLSLLSQAQTRVSTKLGLQLYTQLQNPKYAQSSQLAAIMVQGDPGTVQDMVKKYQGIVKFSIRDISSVAIPYRNLTAFSQERGIIRIEGPVGKGKKFMDTARIINNIDSAQAGYAPLTQAYKGTGVIVGIIDGGIYFRHQDFRRANGNTRILSLWDQYQSTGTSPQPYGYGSAWDSTAINAGLCTSLDPEGDNGHGTNVAGIAAGNGSSWDTGDAYLRGRYTGVAPDADMIVVRYNDTASNFLGVIADAVNYIFTMATAMGRPCVINTSEGTYYGSHDGQDLASQSINAMLEAQKGRVLVAAAGNAGGLQFHLSYALNPTDSLFTWFTYYHRGQVVYYDLWADTSQFKLARFAIGCENNTPAFLARTPYYNADSFNPTQGVTNIIDDSLMQGSTNLGYYQIAVTLSGSTYHVEFEVSPTVVTDFWSLQTLGTGTFDAWVDSAAIGGSSPVRTLPGGFSSPNYRFADSLKTIVSSWQCSSDVITVADYSNRGAYLDEDSVYLDSNVPDGSLIANSSIGPTRDNRIKPDIGATGTVTTATGDSLYIALLNSTSQGYKVSIGGKHTRNGGTSMSSPIVCGCAALYLQEHPHASFSEVKQVLDVTAKHDSFTTYNIPNISWGWGKVNCFRALAYQVVYGCTDTGSVNYNAAANIDTGGCIAKVYGCTDTGSVNYNDSANVNNGACIAKVYGITDSLCSNYNRNANVPSGVCVPLGIAQTGKDVISFDIVPNPLSDNATIVINSTTPLPNAAVRFYDMLGKQIDAINIPAGSSQVTYINRKLAPGIYDAALLSDGKVIATRKIVAE